MLDLERVFDLLELAASGEFSESFSRDAYFEVARKIDAFAGLDVTEEIDELLSSGSWDLNLEEAHTVLSLALNAAEEMEGM